jgi:hypothetical protein
MGVITKLNEACCPATEIGSLKRRLAPQQSPVKAENAPICGGLCFIAMHKSVERLMFTGMVDKGFLNRQA